MATDAKTTRRPTRPAPPPAATKGPLPLRPVEFEFQGTLSDEAIEALARLLLELVDRENDDHSLKNSEVKKSEMEIFDSFGNRKQ
jgi:hypothetical protein